MKNILKRESEKIRSFLAVIVGLSLLAAPLAFVSQQAFAQATTTTPGTGSTTPVTIMVMKHLCASNVRNMTDFMNAENMGMGSTSTSTMSTASSTMWMFANAEWACPTTALPGDLAASSSMST